MNWGKSIVVVFVLFAGFIGTLVFLMSRQQVDLVREDYYQNEVAYQQHIDRVSRTAKLGNAFAIQYQPDQQQLLLTLPVSLKTGEAKLYRPSDRKQDAVVRLQPNGEHRQTIPTAKLAKGYWKVQLTWSDGQQDYFSEQPLTIQ
ncbi:FixH family protein [Larkinella sp. VNQ87]|uniref:FixH family protein n=1 Tax=Larkinella sp. VNQ87 TaxID=3400921 RepID=UPI003BFEA0C2